ncbi:Translocon-associated protein subunit beta [Artemisia annua]|uniref:Translocon-associated protein subunit beta n=1 Tax=Artemisia annua TaxID=35608 RepID=A0A2U1QJW0_ARTAN|nr:Translocon-associated protein subunit beta [Artemisia annua]
MSNQVVDTFRVPTKAALQEAYSTPLLPLEILSDKPRESTLGLKLLAKYGSLVSVISIVVLFVYLVATPSKSGAEREARRNVNDFL